MYEGLDGVLVALVEPVRPEALVARFHPGVLAAALLRVSGTPALGVVDPRDPRRPIVSPRAWSVRPGCPRRFAYDDPVSRARPPWLPLSATLLALGLLGWLAAGGGSAPSPRGDEDGDAAAQGGAAAGARAALHTSARPQAGAVEPDAPPEADHPEDWLLEISEILTPEGQPALGASVFLDWPSSWEDGGVSWSPSSYVWEGTPLRLRLRKAGAEGADAGARCDLPAYEPGKALYVSAYVDGCARWLAPGLVCPPDRTTRLRIQLEPTRELGGVVRAQDGELPPRHVRAVVLTVAGVPPEVYSVKADCAPDGAFAFEDLSDVPTGPVVLRAQSGDPWQDGCAVEQDVAAGAALARLVLRRAHRFRFLVAFAEEADVLPFALRVVRTVAVEPRPGSPRLGPRTYGVTPIPARPLVDMAGDATQELILPEGPAERWRVEVPGYRAREVGLAPSGETREHAMLVRLEPDAQSALLGLEVAVPTPGVSALLDLGLRDDAGLYIPHDGLWAQWRASTDVLRVVVRVPAGPTHRWVAKIWGEPGVSWFIAPFDIALNAGQRYVHKTQAVRGGLLRVRAGPATWASGVRVRLTQGAEEVVVGGAEGSPSRPVFAALATGVWSVEVVRAGEVLPWSTTVEVAAQGVAEVRLPSTEELLERRKGR